MPGETGSHQTQQKIKGEERDQKKNNKHSSEKKGTSTELSNINTHHIKKPTTSQKEQ